MIEAIQMIDRPLGHLVAAVDCSLYVRSPGFTAVELVKVANLETRAKTF